MSTTRQQLRPMKAIPGGTFWMGSACFYPEEGPAIDTATCHLGLRCVVRGASPAGQ